MGLLALSFSLMLASPSFVSFIEQNSHSEHIRPILSVSLVCHELEDALRTIDQLVALFQSIFNA